MRKLLYILPFVVWMTANEGFAQNGKPILIASSGLNKLDDQQFKDSLYVFLKLGTGAKNWNISAEDLSGMIWLTMRSYARHDGLDFDTTMDYHTIADNVVNNKHFVIVTATSLTGKWKSFKISRSLNGKVDWNWDRSKVNSQLVKEHPWYAGEKVWCWQADPTPDGDIYLYPLLSKKCGNGVCGIDRISASAEASPSPVPVPNSNQNSQAPTPGAPGCGNSYTYTNSFNTITNNNTGSTAQTDTTQQWNQNSSAVPMSRYNTQPIVGYVYPENLPIGLEPYYQSMWQYPTYDAWYAAVGFGFGVNVDFRSAWSGVRQCRPVDRSYCANRGTGNYQQRYQQPRQQNNPGGHNNNHGGTPPNFWGSTKGSPAVPNNGSGNPAVPNNGPAQPTDGINKTSGINNQNSAALRQPSAQMQQRNTQQSVRSPQNGMASAQNRNMYSARSTSQLNHNVMSSRQNPSQMMSASRYSGGSGSRSTSMMSRSGGMRMAVGGSSRR